MTSNLLADPPSSPALRMNSEKSLFRLCHMLINDYRSTISFYLSAKRNRKDHTAMVVKFLEEEYVCSLLLLFDDLSLVSWCGAPRYG